MSSPPEPSPNTRVRAWIGGTELPDAEYRPSEHELSSENGLIEEQNSGTGRERAYSEGSESPLETSRLVSKQQLRDDLEVPIYYISANDAHVLAEHDMPGEARRLIELFWEIASTKKVIPKNMEDVIQAETVFPLGSALSDEMWDTDKFEWPYSQWKNPDGDINDDVVDERLKDRVDWLLVLSKGSTGLRKNSLPAAEWITFLCYPFINSILDVMTSRNLRSDQGLDGIRLKRIDHLNVRRELLPTITTRDEHAVNLKHSVDFLLVGPNCIEQRDQIYALERKPRKTLMIAAFDLHVWHHETPTPVLFKIKDNQVTDEKAEVDLAVAAHATFETLRMLYHEAGLIPTDESCPEYLLQKPSCLITVKLNRGDWEAYVNVRRVKEQKCFGPIPIGNTVTILGMFKVIKFIRVVTLWVHNCFVEDWKSVLYTASKNCSARQMSNPLRRKSF